MLFFPWRSFNILFPPFPILFGFLDTFSSNFDYPINISVWYNQSGRTIFIDTGFCKLTLWWKLPFFKRDHSKSFTYWFGVNEFKERVRWPVVLYGCEAWSLMGWMQTRAFENMLRRIFGSKRDANGEWRRLHNEELHSLYRSPNIVRVIKSRRLTWAGHVARWEKMGILSKF